MNQLSSILLTFSIIALCAATTAYAAEDAGPEIAADSGPAETAESRPELAGGTATPANTVPADSPPNQPASDPLTTLGKLVDSVRGGQWRHAASLALILVMLALGKVRGKLKWFKGDRGGAVLVGILALAGALSTALASDAALDWRLFLGAAGVMWTAVGGYTWAKRLIWPKDPA
jgi:hypothetical protein